MPGEESIKVRPAWSNGLNGESGPAFFEQGFFSCDGGKTVDRLFSLLVDDVLLLLPTASPACEVKAFLSRRPVRHLSDITDPLTAKTKTTKKKK